MKPTHWIWQNGVMKKWEDAKIHVMAHGVHYGSTVFEGIRSYDTPNGPAIFRLRDHIQRLFASCKLYRIPVPFSVSEIEDVCREIVSANELTDSYIRPLVYRDVGTLGLTPSRDEPVGVMVAAIEWGPLLGKETAEKGADVCVSSWHRLQSSTNPVAAKAGGHYLTSQLISMEARMNGYAEGIAVNRNGIVTEGAGSNLFMVRQGRVFTPPTGCCILEGITRDTIKHLLQDLGVELVEADITRESLYLADEVFLCGTAAEVTPVSTLDRIEVGSGSAGPLTRKLQGNYLNLVKGVSPDPNHWRSLVQSPAPLGEKAAPGGSAGSLAY